MSDEEESSRNLLRQKRKWLILLLCAVYLTFIFLFIFGFLGASQKTYFEVQLLQLSATMFMLGCYLVIPILLIVFLYILISSRNISTMNNKIIGELPMTFIVISLMIISFITGAILIK